MPLDIASLKALRELDEKIFHLREEQEALPRRLKGAEDALAEARRVQEAKRDEIKAVRKQVDEKNREIKEIEAKVDKLNGQLNTVKTNKEYQALQTEVQDQKAAGSKIEDGALVLMNREEELRNEEKALAAVVAEKERAAAAARREIEASVAEVGKHVAELSGRRDGVLSPLSKELLALYRRIAGAKKDGVALAAVEGDSCGACSATLNSQEINMLMKNKDVVVCRLCSRILYLERQAK